MVMLAEGDQVAVAGIMAEANVSVETAAVLKGEAVAVHDDLLMLVTMVATHLDVGLVNHRAMMNILLSHVM